MISVAIDGPSGAGKSTLARAAARQLGFMYVDTGALYRAVGLAVVRRGKNPKSAADVAAVLPQIQLALKHIDGVQRVFLDGEDVSEAIRTEEASMASSDVAAHPATRAFLLDTQRRLAGEHDVIMDGRDIGTVVLPDADVKIFLTASAEVRAQRRYDELRAKGQPVDYTVVLEDVKTRDYNDSHRAIAPLKQADDAILMETSTLSFQQSLQWLVQLIERHLPGGGGAA